MKVKTENVVGAYNVLKQIKTKELPAEVALAIWKNVKSFKDTATSYEDSVESTKKSLAGDEEEEMTNLLKELQDKEIKEGTGTYTFTRTDNENKIKVTKYFTEAQSKLNKYIKELNDEEVEVTVTTIKEDDLVKAIIGTDYNIGILEVIDFIITKDDTDKADTNK